MTYLTGETQCRLAFIFGLFVALAYGVNVQHVESGDVSITAKPSGNICYIFGGDGISIYDPIKKQIIKTISHDTKLPGTNRNLCTPNARSKTKCSWAGAATVKSKFIFIADSSGNRLIVIDVHRQLPVKDIKTDRFPYHVTYLAALDEVWVLCWGNGTLDVVGEKGGSTLISKISSASSLVIRHTIKAQNAASYKYIMHGYFMAENCQNQDRNLTYGVSSHYNEPGIHKINLVEKIYDKFINTSTSGCKATSGLAYSFVKKYAFVHCLGKYKNKMVIVDVAKDRVVHADDAITNNATGFPYSSPDGKYVLVLNKDRIITYHLEHSSKDVVRLKDIMVPSGFWPSNVAFVRINEGYKAYVTLKNASKLLVVKLEKNQVTNAGYVKGVGAAANMTNIQKTYPRYLPRYTNMLRKTNAPFVQEKFAKYVAEMYMAHITRRIEAGCGLEDPYLASPSGASHKIAIIDGKKQQLMDMVDGVKNPRTILWVAGNHASKGTVPIPALYCIVLVFLYTWL